jgi:energy-coupling factor transporter transmembrane protein EcfT
MSDAATVYGLAAEFNEPEDILEAANKAREAGYKKMDAYVPFPIEGLDEALGMTPTRLGFVVLAMAIIGLLTGFFMQLYSTAIFYPLNIGGRPYNSWPNFVVITFECTILFSAFTAGLFMLGRNGLPRPYHPIFNTPNFDRATRDKFFLCIEAVDENFDLQTTKDFLNSLNPNAVSEVAP